MRATTIDIPLIVGGKEIRTNKQSKCYIPHEHMNVLATFHEATEKEVRMAIDGNSIVLRFLFYSFSFILAFFFSHLVFILFICLAALNAKKLWSEIDFETRASVFLKAAELLSGPWRSTLLAATILGQSKNIFQAEIDAAAELIDFLRFNAYFAQEIYNDQPLSSKGVWNRLVYRPLEGFIYAITPV